MLLISYEGTNFGWTVFFVFLAFAILFHTLDEQEKEIAALRSPKEDSEEWKKYAKKKRELETDPRSYDPFYGSSSILTPEEKEKILNKKKGAPKEKKEEEETEIIFIPTLRPGMEKQWGKPKTAEELLGKLKKNNDKNWRPKNKVCCVPP